MAADELLVLGILPSEASVRGGAARARSYRQAARRTWLASSPAGLVTRFVFSAAANADLRRRRRRLADDRSVVLHTPSASTCACAELVHAWFAHALAEWPRAHFVGKTEDDIMVSLPALHFEVARLRGLAEGGQPLWWGLMAWTGNGGVEHPRVGCWGGGFEDDPLLSPKGVRGTLSKERGCPEGAQPLAPAPTHEVELRSRGLAHALAGCDYPRRWLDAMSGGRRCPNDCAAVQGLWLTRCLRRNVTLAHATWSKVHANSLDAGWRPFAPPANLTVVLDMNLGDKKLRQLANDHGGDAPWERAHAAMHSTTASAFPPLLYSYEPTRRAGSTQLMAPLNSRVAALHYGTCRWGGCHPSRGEPTVVWPAWLASAPWPSTSAEALGIA